MKVKIENYSVLWRLIWKNIVTQFLICPLIFLRKQLRKIFLHSNKNHYY